LRGIDFTGAAYVSPYTITYTCDYNSLTNDFNTSPRDSITEESDLDYSKWYDISNQYYLIMGNNGASSCSTSSNPYSVTATWGPQSRQYPAVQVPDPSTAGGDTLTWQRERVVAVGQKHLGLSYQHHHIPDFNPYAVDLSWPASCPAVLVNYPIAGIDCSNFSSWNYNYGLGIKLDSALPAQSQTTTPIPGPGGTGSITPQVIGQGADYETLKSLLQTGDLLYIRAGTGKPVSHVIMWLGSIGKDPNESMPLVIDSHDNAPPIQDCNSVTIPPGVQIRPFRSNEYYFQQFDHAFRIIHGDSTSSVAHLLLSD
jgi:cell wall-associated NlpC family hydrolase